MLGKKVGIDLGSTLMRVHVKGEAVITTDPSVVAMETGHSGRRIVATGRHATEVPRDRVELRSVLDAGAVADSFGLDALLHAAVTRACGRQRIFKPDVMVAVLSEMGGTDRLAVLDACARAGARTMYLIDRPMAAAIGAAPAGPPMRARLVVDVGATTTDAALIADEGAVVRFWLKRGGALLTADIARHLGELHGVAVPMTAAEEVKRELASAVRVHEERTLRIVVARDGAPIELVVSSADVEAVIEAWLGPLDVAVAQLLDECPAALRSDLEEHTGILLSGGGAQLRGLDRHVAAVTGIPTRVAVEPALVTARGAALALESLEVVRRTFLYVR